MTRSMLLISLVLVLGLGGLLDGRHEAGADPGAATLPVVVVVRADWCAPCKKVEPVLRQVLAEFQGKVVSVVLDVSTAETRAAARALARRHGLEAFFDARKDSTATVAALCAGRVEFEVRGPRPAQVYRDGVEAARAACQGRR